MVHRKGVFGKFQNPANEPDDMLLLACSCGEGWPDGEERAVLSWCISLLEEEMRAQLKGKETDAPQRLKTIAEELLDEYRSDGPGPVDQREGLGEVLGDEPRNVSSEHPIRRRPPLQTGLADSPLPPAGTLRVAEGHEAGRRPPKYDRDIGHDEAHDPKNEREHPQNEVSARNTTRNPRLLFQAIVRRMSEKAPGPPIGIAVDTIADLVGIRPGTVQGHLRKAQKKLVGSQ